MKKAAYESYRRRKGRKFPASDMLAQEVSSPDSNRFTVRDVKIVAVSATIFLAVILILLFSPLLSMFTGALKETGSFVSTQTSSLSHNAARMFDLTPTSGIKKYLAEHANDPSSVEIVSVSEPSRPWSDGTRLVRCSYRAKNGFGALMLTTWTFRLNPDNSVAVANDPVIW